MMSESAFVDCARVVCPPDEAPLGVTQKRKLLRLVGLVGDRERGGGAGQGPTLEGHGRRAGWPELELVFVLPTRPVP